MTVESAWLSRFSWVAIQKPTDRENAVQAIVDINGHGISTSGSYRNYYELDGKRISHVSSPHRFLRRSQSCAAPPPPFSAAT